MPSQSPLAAAGRAMGAEVSVREREREIRESAQPQGCRERRAEPITLEVTGHGAAACGDSRYTFCAVESVQTAKFNLRLRIAGIVRVCVSLTLCSCHVCSEENTVEGRVTRNMIRAISERRDTVRHEKCFPYSDSSACPDLSPHVPKFYSRSAAPVSAEGEATRTQA